MFLFWGKEHIFFYNDTYLPILNNSGKHPSALGKPGAEVWGEVWHNVKYMIDQVLSGGEAILKEDEFISIFCNGKAENIYWTFSYSSVTDEIGQPAGVFFTCMEIIEKVANIKNLAKSNKNLELAMEHLQIAIEGGQLGAFDNYPQTGEMNWSVKTKELFGLPPDAKVDYNIFINSVHPEDLDLCDALSPKTRKLEKGGFCENIYRTIGITDKKIRWVRSKGKFTFNAEGIPVRFTGIAQDITDHKEAEEALKESEERFRIMADAAPNFVWALNPDGSIKYGNKYALEFFGISLEKLIADTWYPYAHPEEIELLQQKVMEVNTEWKIYAVEQQLKRYDGEYRWILTKGAPSFYPSGDLYGYVGSSIDITELKEAEAALRESEKHFRALADNISQFAWMADEKGAIYWYNKRWFDFTGSNFQESKDFGWQKFHHPEHIKRVLENISYCLSTGTEWEDIFPLRGKDGKYRWFLTRAIPIRNEKDTISSWFGTNTDITEQKMANEQLEIKNAELLRTNNDLDNFIYTASHDLKAPILNIEGLVNFLEDILNEENSINEKVNSMIGMIHQSIDRFKTTIKDLAEVAKAQSNLEEDQGVVSFKEILEEVKHNIQYEIDKANALIEDDFSKVPVIYFSQKNLRSILYNLISNSIKYRSPERQVVIFISSAFLDNDHILLTVKDNGLGRKKEDQPKVFTMFKRMHQHVDGTGVGLSIVKKIIDNNGGRIEIESKVKEGSLFKVFFKVK
ncbi:hypothetical protein BH23BAC1_BH23BAC1_46230 [soil metagenome]